jgi:predicted DNA-binding transcriptional regulator AlpA
MNEHTFETAEDGAVMVSLPYVLLVTGYGRSSAYKAMKDGTLPRPVKVGRSSRWPRDEMHQVHEAMTRGDDKPALRALVRQLRQRRGGSALSLVRQ